MDIEMSKGHKLPGIE